MRHLWQVCVLLVLSLQPRLTQCDRALLLRLLPRLFLRRPLQAQGFLGLPALLVVGLLPQQFLLPVRLRLHCALLEQRRLALPTLQVALDLLMLAFLFALQILLFAPGSLFGVVRVALWR